tara:strand:+ start:212799 stop:213161 length:363 start_codon:yes stop_codon:yes gene_type:complete
MARRVYNPGDKNSENKSDKAPEPQKTKTQTAAVRAAAMAIVRRTRKTIDPKILEVARKALPESEEDINKMFFGSQDLLKDETVPIDRKKNIETVFSLLENDTLSAGMKEKVAAAMKDLVV